MRTLPARQGLNHFCLPRAMRPETSAYIFRFPDGASWFLASPLAHDVGTGSVPKGKRWAPFSAIFTSPGCWPSIPP